MAPEAISADFFINLSDLFNQSEIGRRLNRMWLEIYTNYSL
jgi:hypothetical protein